MTKKGSSTKNLSEIAYRRILDRILRGKMPLGAPISRRSVAEQLKIGLLPVTEALQRLESEGLVESRPRVGTRVRVPTADDINGHYIIREALETQSARLFSEFASDKARGEMKRLACELDEANTRQNVAERYDVHNLHLRFHIRLAEGGGCKPLVDAIEKNQIMILNWLYDVASGVSVLPPDWHGQLMEAVAGHDLDAADRAMRRHVRFRYEEVQRGLKDFAARHTSEDAGFRSRTSA